MNMVAIIDGQPKLLNLKQVIDAFLRHRREVVTRRTIFELRKARERGHVLEGLAVALSNVDEIIALIKAAPTPADAKRELMARGWRFVAGGRHAEPRQRMRRVRKVCCPSSAWSARARPRLSTSPMRRRRRSWKCACNA